MIRLHRPDFDWYLQRLFAGTPTTLLLYGDGEFRVMMRQCTGQTMAYSERVQSWLEDEMLASLELPGYDILRGTDPFLIDWRSYPGRDVVQVSLLGQQIETLLEGYDLDFYDATGWETAVLQGKFAPFLQWIQQQQVVLVGHPALATCRYVHHDHFVPIPPRDAVADLDRIEHQVFSTVQAYNGKPVTVLLCMGLGAIPLIGRLHGRLANVTFLDLGSHLDFFIKFPTRGWREEVYRDEAKYQELLAVNTQGVALCLRGS